MKKKIIIILSIALCISLVATIALILHKNTSTEKPIQFFYEDILQQEAQLEIDVFSEEAYSPEQIGLVAKQGEDIITDQITYDIIEGENAYTIVYTIEEVTFTLSLQLSISEETMQPTTQVIENPNDISALVNKQNYLPEDYVPDDLVLIESTHYLRMEAAKSLNALLADIRNQNITVNVVSSYRSKEYQTTLYNNYYAQDPEGAPIYSALPRTSEHEMGLAVDLSYDYSLHEDLDETTLGIYLDEHAHKYGFILRYPEDKTHITGYMFEAWHYRYVGVELATQLKEENITLEEYYEK